MSRPVAAIVGAILLTWVHPARAESTADVEAILQDPVVTTPSSSASGASVAPGTSTSVSSEELRAHGIRTLDEAINYLTLGMMTGHNMHSVEVGARGVLLHADYNTHVLLLVNGVPQNEPWNGTANFDRGAGVPFELVDHIEVMLGPGSVIYGSQAMLGVVNIVTKRARNYAGLHLITEAELASPLGPGYTIRSPSSGGYASDLGKGTRWGFGYGREFRLFNSPAELTLQLEYYRFRGAAIEFANQDYGEDAVTGQPKSFGPGQTAGVWGGKATRSWYSDVPTSFMRLMFGDFTLAGRAGAYTRSAPYNDYLIRSFGDFDPPRDYERDTFFDLSLRHEKALSSVLALSSQVYAASNRYRWFNSSSAAEDCEAWQTTGCRYDLKGNGRRFGADVRGTLDWNDPLHMSTVLGGSILVRDVYSSMVARSEFGDAQSMATIDTTDALGALHVQQLLRPVRIADINLGGRFDIDNRFGQRFSPRTALAITSWTGATWKASYSEAFRAPSAYELNYTDRLTQIPATSLSPEITRTVELSFEQRVAAHRFLVGVFRSWWSDLVYLAALSPEEVQSQLDSGKVGPDATEVWQYRNVARIDNWGFNAAYGLAFLDRRLRFDTNVTGAKTRVHDGGFQPGEPVSAPRFFGNARITIDPGLQLPVIGLASVFRSRSLSDRYYDGGFARPPTAPQSWELRTTLSGHVPAARGLSYRVSFSYNLARVAPYNIGAMQYAYDASTPAHLQPINRFYGFAGLQYDY